jgi:hypothetical protein
MGWLRREQAAGGQFSDLMNRGVPCRVLVRTKFAESMENQTFQLAILHVKYR